MTGSEADEAARLLWHAWSAGALLAQLPAAVRPADMADAYAIQASLDAHAGRRIGWKIAATGAGGRAALGVEHPLAGPLYERFAVAPGGEVEVSRQRLRTVEAEFGFMLARDLPAAGAPFHRAAILDALGAFVPAIEMPDTRYADHRAMGGPHLVADAALAGRYVLGAPIDDYDPERLASHELTLTTPSQGTAEGSGAKVLGDPIEAVGWLANALAEHGLHLASGDVVITGAAVAVRDPGAGPLLADFGELGALAVTLS
jgi:2-keto-4-pentenoate hydratase